MSTKLLIDRSTIRRNPDCGRTHYDIPGLPTYTVEVYNLASQALRDHIVNALEGAGWLLVTDSGSSQLSFELRGSGANGQPLAAISDLLPWEGLSYSTGCRRDDAQVYSVFPQPAFLYSYYPQQRECPCCGGVLNLPADLLGDDLFCWNCDIPVGDEDFEVERLTNEELKAIATENERKE